MIAVLRANQLSCMFVANKSNIANIEHFFISLRMYFLLRPTVDYLCILDPAVGLAAAKGKVLPYSLTSVGPRTDPCVQAVRPQVTF